MNKALWIVVPAYNEASRIGSVLERILKAHSHVIVVDDGSKDDTYSVSYNSGAYVLRNIVNMGKGAALRTGIDFAVSKGAEQIVVIDSDGQHKPEQIPELVVALKNHDIVFTYRERSGPMPLVLRFGNWFINKTTKLLYGMELKDTQCGFRAFTVEAYKKIRWKSGDYSMESEMIARAGRHHLQYTEIPIETIYLDRYKGTTVLHGIKIVMDMLSWKFMR